MLEEDGKLRQSEGGYTDYVNRKEWENLQQNDFDNGKTGLIGKAASAGAGADSYGSESTESAENTSGKNWKSNQKKKLKFSYQEQRDYESIEGEIAALEEKIAQIDRDSLKYTSDFVKLNELAGEKEKAEKQLEEKMDRWMYLEDLAARIEQGETV